MARTRHTALTSTFAFLASLVASTGAAFAQAPAPPPVWAGSVGAGVAVTSGNADTTNYNLTFKVTHNPDNPHLMTAEALHLQGTNNGDLVVDRSLATVRDEYTLSTRSLVYGQLRYLRDSFKQIDYLLAPGIGLGYKLVNLEPTRLAVDAGFGAVFEKNPGLPTNTSGAVNMSETFSHKLSQTASVTQAFNGLWKAAEFGDALYTLSVGLTAAITPRSTIKIEALETYKTRPPVPTIQKQDVALVTSFVYGF
jgi:putative salt-induced outer membrane protein YdiY